MEQVNDILESLKNMDKEVYLVLSIPEDLNIQFLYFENRQAALDNLFSLALSTTDEIVNHFVLEDFLKEYTKSKEDYQDAMYKTLQSIMPSEAYSYLINGTCFWKINSASSVVIIKKTPF